MVWHPYQRSYQGSLPAPRARRRQLGLIGRDGFLRAPFRTGGDVDPGEGDHRQGDQLGAERKRRQRDENRSHALADAGADLRSEEHTSELQSLMRISYAVFCLKKTTQEKTTNKYKVTHLKTHE